MSERPIDWLELRVIVDRGRCQGYANCLDAAPDAFDLDEHDIAVVRRQRFGASERERLDRAVRRCPAQALHLEDATTGDRLT
jgi:ferredoxin